MGNVDSEGIQVRNAGKDIVPKGGLELITTKLCSSYDYLWLMAIVGGKGVQKTKEEKGRGCQQDA